MTSKHFKLFTAPISGKAEIGQAGIIEKVFVEDGVTIPPLIYIVLY